MRDKFVEMAKSQIGIRESGTNNVKYNTWYYGHTVNGRAGTSEYAWCVTFECWCANQIGILGKLIPKCNNVGVLRGWYKAKGLYHLRSSYIPKKGDLIIFKNASHTGIVEKVLNSRVWTIEGNSHDRVSNNSYSLTDSYINGYCEVKFDNNDNSVKTVQKNLNQKYNAKLAIDDIAGEKTHKALVKALQTELNKQFSAGLKVDGDFGPLTKSKCPIISKGSRGNITWLIQATLICKGYNIALDSVFGAKTEEAVRDYQSKHGLIVDGKVGKNTFEQLLK